MEQIPIPYFMNNQWHVWTDGDIIKVRVSHCHFERKKKKLHLVIQANVILTQSHLIQHKLSICLYVW